jgi:hypothetical protein
LLTRIPVIVFGCAGALWGLVNFPTFWTQSSLERVARRIVNGETFSAEALNAQLPEIRKVEAAPVCRPAALRSAAIGRLRMAEPDIASRHGPEASAAVRAVRNSIVKALSCSPADGFLWLALFWIDSGAQGVKPKELEYLKLSYRVSPNEGWIALKRSYLAFSAFQDLTPDLQESALAEFVGLIKSGYYQEGANILSGPAWPARDVIVSRLASLPLPVREAFASAIRKRDLNLEIPGVSRQNARPWD